MAEIRETLSLEDRFTDRLVGIIKKLEEFSDRMDMNNYKTGAFEKQCRTQSQTLRDVAFNASLLANRHSLITRAVDQGTSAVNRFNSALNSVKGGFGSMHEAMLRAQQPLFDFQRNLSKLDSHFSSTGFKGLVFGITIGNAMTRMLYAIARAPGEILKMGDTFILTQAKMAVATNSTSEALRANDLVYNAAQRSRSEYGEMAANVSKIGVAAKRYFNSTEEMVRFAETVSKSFTVAGATGEMRRNSTLQLIQALGSGKLQGDEFKSISEGAPLLLDALEKYTGIERGLLKEAGKKGELTSDILKGAIIAFGSDIDAAFEKMPTTFEQACIQMSNKLTYAFNPILEEISKAGASIITDWNVNLWEVVKTLLYIGAIMTVLLIPSMVRLVMATVQWVVAALSFLGLLILANPWVIVLVGAFAMVWVAITKSKEAFKMFFADLAEGLAKVHNWIIDVAIGFQRWINAGITLINVFRAARGEQLVKPANFVSEADKINTNEVKWNAYLKAGNAWDQFDLFKKRLSDKTFGLPGPDLSKIMQDGAMPVNVKGGKLDKVKIYEEDLVLLKDLAMREYQLNFSQITPQLEVKFGDVHETADVDGIVKKVSQDFIESLKNNLRGGVVVG